MYSHVNAVYTPTCIFPCFQYMTCLMRCVPAVWKRRRRWEYKIKMDYKEM
jgi:hypothetical protein